jgi:N-acetylmuramoyl-L-alanine amidase
MTREIIKHPSPNFGPRPADCPIDILVLHYTGMQTGQAALDRLCDPQSSVSSHYVIEEDGRIFQLVDEADRAWHAGLGCWQGCRDINSQSIGIEIVNPGHEFGYRPFPDAQIASVIALSRDIVKRHSIRPDRVIGHSDIAPDRKEDPGELFPWQKLAENGIGLWPKVDELPAVPNDVSGKSAALFYELLTQIGYDADDATDHHAQTVAFQRHWRPSDISGRIDAECIAIATALASQVST